MLSLVTANYDWTCNSSTISAREVCLQEKKLLRDVELQFAFPFECLLTFCFVLHVELLSMIVLQIACLLKMFL